MAASNGVRNGKAFTRHGSRNEGSIGIGRFLSALPIGPLFALVLVSYSAFVGAGYMIGYQQYSSDPEYAPVDVETENTAILGLLAFMLSFTFSVTWTRFTRRNSLIISHAQAISICFLRTALIPEKQKQECRRYLYEYINILLLLQTTPQLEKALARIDELHSLIWNEAVSLTRMEMDPPTRSLFISAANDLQNQSVSRKFFGLHFSIPDAIWISLLFLGIVGMLSFGYQTGVKGEFNVLQLIMLPLAFGLVIVLIAELNSSYDQRWFKVTQRPLRDVLDMMEKNTPRVFA